MTVKKEITSRADVFELVDSFYSKIKRDKNLGPIFNRMLATESMWAEHLEKLTDFWESNLFGVMKFKGNPMAAHQKVDKVHKNSISQDHFYDWLMLWNETVNTLFVGEKAELAKEKARRMSTHLFMDILKNKPK